MLDVRRLRVLAEVAARGSFSAAGEAMTLTQSAVSQHVAALEREVGQTLIVRGTRPLEMTEAGDALVRHASGIFARLDGAEQELGEIAGRRHGRLRFGTFPVALATLVPPAFTHFRRRHPDVTLTVVDDHLQRLIPRLEGGELDLALIYDHETLDDIASPDFELTPLLDEAFRAVLPAGHRLSRRRGSLKLTDLGDEPWIGGAATSPWYRIVSDACRRVGFTPQVGFASDNNIAIQALVAAGLGVSVIPDLAVAHPLPGVEVRALGSDAPVRRILAARPRDAFQGRAVTAMIDSLRKVADAHTLIGTRP